MKKPFSYLGDDWGEVVFNAVILILFGPIYLLLMLLVVIFGIISKILHLPMPGEVPFIVGKSVLPHEEMASLYLEAFKKQVNGLTTDLNENSIKIMSKKATVDIWWEDDFLGIELRDKDEKLDTGFWHTGESEDLDLFFWYAVSALREGIIYKLNFFGRKIGWIYSKEMSIWMGVSCNFEKYNTSFIKYARKI